MEFLSTISLRRATVRYRHISFRRFNFYPRSPCGERPRQAGQQQQHHNISIHALLAESDRFGCGNILVMSISIHALLAESDGIGLVFLWWGVRFLSTLSLRRATHYDNYNLHCVDISIHALLAESDKHSANPENRKRNFYPRSPCGERQANAVDQILPGHISIHALLAESDWVLMGGSSYE